MRKKKFSEERRALITHLKRFDYGKEQVNRVIAPTAFVLSVFTLLKVYGISFTTMQIIVAILFAVAVIYLIGVMWDRLGMIEEEIEYGNERNRFVKALLKRSWLRKLRKSEIVR